MTIYRIRVSGYIDYDDYDHPAGAADLATPTRLRTIVEDMAIGLWDLEGLQLTSALLTPVEAEANVREFEAKIEYARRVGERMRHERARDRANHEGEI